MTPHGSTARYSRKTHYVAPASALCLWLWSACPKPPPPPPPVLDAGPVDAGPQPIPGVHLLALVDAGLEPPAPQPLPDDGGAPNPSDGGQAGGVAEVTPALPARGLDLALPDASVPDVAAIEFTASAPLEDARFRLLTEDDRLVPNHAEVAIADGGTRVVLTPTPYWPVRGCCRFVVDGDTERLPTGGEVRYLGFETSFGVAADPARLKAAEAAKQRQRQHQHHHRSR